MGKTRRVRLKRRIILVFQDMEQKRRFVSKMKRRGYEVACYDDPDQCFRSAPRLRSVGVFLVGVTMQSADRYDPAETEGHIYTGLLLGTDLRNAHPGVPIVFLGSDAFSDSDERIGEAISTIGNCAFVSEQRFRTPDAFADQIEAVLADGIKVLKKGLWARVWETLTKERGKPETALDLDIIDDIVDMFD